jgi:hypothetical protein
MQLGRRQPIDLILLWLGAMLLAGSCLAGCSLPASGLTGPAAKTRTPTQTHAPPPPASTATPLPALGFAIVSDPATIPDSALPALADLARDSGMRWQEVADSGAIDFGGRVVIVVAFAPDPGIQSLAAAHPDTQFLAVQIPGLSPSPNLTTIGGDQKNEAAFAAGFLAEAVSADWRGAIIVDSGEAGSVSWAQSFQDGGAYLCGLCRPAYPPFLGYPQVISFGGDEGANQVLQQLGAAGVRGIYLSNDKVVEALAGRLDSDQFILLGSQSPGTLPANWGATIRMDPLPAIRQIWDELVSGTAVGAQAADIVLADVNPHLISPGRLERAESMIADLQAGAIDPGGP